MREVILDIETIPCELRVWKALEEELRRKFLKDKPDDDTAWKSTALDPSLGRIVCIGLLFVQNGKEQPQVHVEPDEAALLTKFWKAITEEDYIIGHNVLSFDLPFIRARSVVCKVRPTRQFDLRRYCTQTIYDTMQLWSNWDMRAAPKLALLGKALGLKGKLGSGVQVYDWYRNKQWKKIESYCLQDVRLTNSIYRRMRQYGL